MDASIMIWIASRIKGRQRARDCFGIGNLVSWEYSLCLEEESKSRFFYFEFILERRVLWQNQRLILSGALGPWTWLSWWVNSIVCCLGCLKERGSCLKERGTDTSLIIENGDKHFNYCSFKTKAKFLWTTSNPLLSPISFKFGEP